MISKIKLFKIDELSNGTQRFQSQLYIGKNAADFIMDINGIMKCYGRGKNGFDFYPYNGQYEIVLNKSDMLIQSI